MKEIHEYAYNDHTMRCAVTKAYKMLTGNIFMLYETYREYTSLTDRDTEVLKDTLKALHYLQEITAHADTLNGVVEEETHER